MNAATMPQVRLIKFGGLSCHVCIAMDQARTLEKFIERHPEVRLLKLDVNDKEGDSPDGSDFEKNFKLSDALGVEVLPTLIFEVKGGGELLRFEGAATLKELEESYLEAVESWKASQQIPWTS